jgi:hypothetical protein
MVCPVIIIIIFIITARSIGIIVGFTSIAAGSIGAIASMITHAVVIYYLYRPNVKAFFGK